MNGDITRDNNSLWILLGPSAAELPSVALLWSYYQMIICEALNWSRSCQERETREKLTQIKTSDLIIFQDSRELCCRHRKLMKEMNDWKCLFFSWADVTAIFEAWSQSLRIGSYLRETLIMESIFIFETETAAGEYHIKKFCVKYIFFLTLTGQTPAPVNT